jgi:hypothetical protein
MPGAASSMRGGAIYAGAASSKKKMSSMADPSLRAKRAKQSSAEAPHWIASFAPLLAMTWLVFIRLGSRTQVMNYAGAASSMRGGVIYAGRCHLCGAVSSMRGGVMYAGRCHLCGAASSMRGSVIYAGRCHLCGVASSMRASAIYAGWRHLCGASSLGRSAIYVGRHLWGAAPSMA